MAYHHNEWTINPDDIHILRDLFKRQREIAQDPVMEERRRLWTEHASLRSRRPMILAETSGVLDEIVPVSSLRCQEEWARTIERSLRELIFRYESVGDDFVIEPRIRYGWFVEIGDFGVQVERRRAENNGRLGSYRVDPPIKDLDRDLDRLHFRSLRVDREKTAAWAALLEEQFGDILPVINRGWYWWTTGLTIVAIDLIGLEQLMLAMIENPAGLHRLMAFLRDEMLHYLDWFEREGLLSLNNEDDYIGSGSIGYTSELPAPDWQPGQPVRLCDMWGLAESQETVGVSPRMFEEFVFQYQYPIITRFGLSYYGCCEPLHTRIKIIKRLPNLRRVSVSPWCNQEIMADELGKDYIFCRKPSPTLISTAVWDEEAIREDLRTTLRIARGCPLELVMKDVHTLYDQPWRLGRWVQLAREVCAEFGYG
ncbi:MAG: hypothetical protein RML36_09915 [Anaerolineae bacterium]|nr:hypothetical protein [Anaerolineae bacterium]MDW8099782.1 hypothetical protein [Anaerolineae bacterium]